MQLTNVGLSRGFLGENIPGYLLICRWQKGRLRLGIRKKKSIISMVMHWHRLPREAVDVPFHSRSSWMEL